MGITFSNVAKCQAPANLPQLKKTLSPVQIALENKDME